MVPPRRVERRRHHAATLLQTFTSIEGLPRSITFSPSGRLLATDGRDRTVRIIAVDAEVR